MIYPGVDEALTAIIATVEQEIAPKVTDDLAASLCRTAAQMLRSVQVRVSGEVEALADDNAELAALLAGLGERVPLAAAGLVEQALALRPAPVYPALGDLQADAERLRGALVAVVSAVPEGADPRREQAREYLRHQLGREKAWLQDAFTGPRR